MIDPYQVLGIPRNATEEEIKKAYRQKAKQYHPDLHPGDTEAARKMNEVNEAYDMLKNPEKYERKRAQEQQQNAYRQNTYQGYGSQSGYQNYQGYRQNSYQYDDDSTGQGYGYGGFYGFNFDDFFGGFSGRNQYYDAEPTVQSGDSPELARAIRAINQRKYQEAVYILSQMTSTYRNARWYYVSAIAYHGIGDHTQAYAMIQKAVQADPQNRLYQQLMRQYSQFSSSSAGGYRRYSSGFSIIRVIGIVLLLLFLMRLLFGCMSYRYFMF